ncbi:DUF2550 domain-containing protein [Nocardioides sp. CER19]|uniref:DUF2550 domain-containing protein n=1 Tax=Nocardioides sp. CER19 TaxID=3038538 RepID=UPI00244743FD|nr:DUF2550 domain-containing protein [Nocardioides sp. CER19]MDH2415383.1 DUF2550 domain-containing protein [Nocardioides sp. CER19]
MPTWEWGLDAVGVLLVLVVCYFLALLVRRRVIGRHGGTFELSHRVRAGRPGRGWLLGVGRYSGETLEWFRVFSLSPRPKRSWQRIRMSYDSSRVAEGAESMALYPGHVIVTCQYDGRLIDFAMAPASLTGFQAWLESRPPGTDWSR